MKTKPIRGLAAAAVVLAVIGLVFSGVHTASMVQPQTDEIATVVAGRVEATISLKEIKIGIFVQQTLDAYYYGTPTPTPPARVENVETSIAGTLEAMQPTATYTDEDREIATAVHETVMAILSFATPTPGELSPMRMTLAAMERMLTETASVGAPQPLANAPEAGQVWNYPVPSATPPAPLPDASQPLVLPGGSSESPAPPEKAVPPPDEGSPESPEPPDEESPPPPPPPEKIFPPPPDPPPPDTWSVYIEFDLNGGHWPAKDALQPGTVTAMIGENIGDAAFSYVRSVKPIREGFEFVGWSVRFTNPGDGTVIYDGGINIWDLNKPFTYDPSNPPQMNCLMKAQWAEVSPPLPPPDPNTEPERGVWTLNVSFDLQGGEFINWNGDRSKVINTPIGQDIDMFEAFWGEMRLKPVRKKDRILGWSALLSDSETHSIVYDGRGSIWSLMTPFTYNPYNPPEMDLVLIANWGPPIPMPTSNFWRVYIQFELDRFTEWGTHVGAYEIVAVIGQDMPYHSFDPIRTATVYKPGHKFHGWTVRCDDATNGKNIFNLFPRRIWNLEKPFSYNPKYSNEWSCVFRPVFTEISEPEKVGYWKVEFIYDLGHGKWMNGEPPDVILTPIGQDMPLTSIKKYVPVKENAKFLGWSVRIKAEYSSEVIYDGGESIWDLDFPFIYYPDNSESQIAWMTARWEYVNEQQPMILKPSNPPAPPPDEEEPEPEEEELELPPPPEPEIELDDYVIEFLDLGQGLDDFDLPTILWPTPSWPTAP